jgi:sec-independent protein translocase protein TatB
MFPEARGVEFLIIAALALIVVGPKELPGLLRKLGQFVGKMRNIANDFRTSFDEMARQSELDDLRKQVEEMRAETAAALPSDPLADPEMDKFRRDFDAQMTSTPNYGGASSEPESVSIVEPSKPVARKKAAAPKPAASKSPKTPTAKGTIAAAKKAPAKTPAKPKRAASKDIVQ